MIKKIVLGFLLFGIVAVLGTAGFLYFYFNQPYHFYKSSTKTHMPLYQASQSRTYKTIAPFLNAEKIIKEEYEKLNATYDPDDIDFYPSELLDWDEIPEQTKKDYDDFVRVHIAAYTKLSKMPVESTDLSFEESSNALFAYNDYIRFKTTLVLYLQLFKGLEFNQQTYSNLRTILKQIDAFADADSNALIRLMQNLMYKEFILSLSPYFYNCSEESGELNLLSVELKTLATQRLEEFNNEAFEHHLKIEYMHSIDTMGMISGFSNLIHEYYAATIRYSTFLVNAKAVQAFIERIKPLNKKSYSPKEVRIKRIKTDTLNYDMVKVFSYDQVFKVYYNQLMTFKVMETFPRLFDKQCKGRSYQPPLDVYSKDNRMIFDENKLYSVGRDGKISQEDDIEDEIIYLDIKELPYLGQKIVEPTRIEIPKAEVDEAMSDPAKFYSQIRLVPYFAKGQSAGFKIISVEEGSLFKKYGLLRGDIVESHNGKILEVQSALSLINSFKEPNQVHEIVILRKGKKLIHEYIIVE